MRLLIAILVCSATAGIAACGGSGRDTASSTTGRLPPTTQQIATAHENAVDAANGALIRAARDRDRQATARAQRRLDELARTQLNTAGTSAPSAADPYRGVLDDFRFKQAPLYVQQVNTSDGDHRLFVAVLPGAFCLTTTEARLTAATAVYEPLDRRLRAHGVKDFVFMLVPLTQTSPTAGQALAVGRHGQLRLTRRGRTC